ncbi:EGF domain-specific O-linked N-acetylglucosamine transferase [Colletotrichum shisoi]|uniref:EGF domain-specific O-linked N-acetylglucosamine transferase n=1 Tax=Colletotrichum shisoi TaxID=2078593 RepID=A0A5Q4BBI6_9PEZI|nr:EGF domain-specific O-linked N-acetylglucosamine transferase [Colletotrichum shisoi]
MHPHLRLITKRGRLSVLLALILLLAFLALLNQRGAAVGLQNPFRYGKLQQGSEVLTALPELAASSRPEQQTPEPEFCTPRFSPDYLYGLRDRAIQYCSPASTPSAAAANLTCFHSRTQDRDDAFCFAQGAVLDPSTKTFNLDCDVRLPTANESSRGIIPFTGIRGYWYDTGPGVLFQKYVKVANRSSASSTPEQIQPRPSQARPIISILLKREGAWNIWHSLMELWSMTMSLDVLRMAPDPAVPTKPFFHIPADTPRTQVVFLDDHPEGPLYPLWGMFAGREPVRLADILKDPARSRALAETPQSLVIPLAGSSNPTWMNDWVERDCKDAPLMRLFTQRVMHHCGVVQETGPRPTEVLNVTLIDRRGTRKLLNQDALLYAARAKFPGVNFQTFDFAALPFPDQLRIVQSTDVLVGVHGAALTHTMFLREGGAAVVEIQPSSMSYKGFRNMAQMRGQAYVSAHAEMFGAEDRVDRRRNLAKRHRWQWVDVRIEEDQFLQLITEAIESLPGRGT